jgi:DNA-directed RNA polymerase subunit K/omega
MEGQDYYEMVIIPAEDRITLDVLSEFEIATIVSHRISQIGKGDMPYLNAQDYLVDTEGFTQDKKLSIAKEELISKDGKTFIKLSRTADIAKAELNTGKCPYLVVRTIVKNEKNKKIYAEIINPNELEKSILKYEH